MGTCFLSSTQRESSYKMRPIPLLFLHLLLIVNVDGSPCGDCKDCIGSCVTDANICMGICAPAGMRQWMDGFTASGTCLPKTARGTCSPPREDNCKEGYYAKTFRIRRQCGCKCEKKN